MRWICAIREPYSSRKRIVGNWRKCEVRGGTSTELARMGFSAYCPACERALAEAELGTFELLPPARVTTDAKRMRQSAALHSTSCWLFNPAKYTRTVMFPQCKRIYYMSILFSATRLAACRCLMLCIYTIKQWNTLNLSIDSCRTLPSQRPRPCLYVYCLTVVLFSFWFIVGIRMCIISYLSDRRILL